MKIQFVFALCFFFTISIAQTQVSEFSVSDANVRRKKVQSIDQQSIAIQRKSIKLGESNGEINLEKKDKDGKVIWSKYYGGSGYEYAGSFIKSNDGGYLIIGTTSSYGKGNNDVFLIKTDDEGEEIWSKTFGGFFNEYGKFIKELPNGDIVIKAQKQFCEGENVGTNCFNKTWILSTDSKGKLKSESISD